MPRTVTIQHIADKVRTVTNDTASPYRTEDPEIIGWVNDCVSSCVSIVPQLFTKQGTHTATAGTRQDVVLERSAGLVDVLGVPPADLAALTAFKPGWQADDAGPIQNWLRPANETLSFFTYPPQAGGEEIPIVYIEAPAKMTLITDIIPLPEVYEPAIVAYCVSMVEAKDDEHVLSQRSAQFMADFAGRIKGGA